MSAGSRAVQLAPRPSTIPPPPLGATTRAVQLNLVDLGHHDEHYLEELLGPSHALPVEDGQSVLLLPRSLILRVVNLCAQVRSSTIGNGTREQPPNWLSTILHFSDDDDDLSSVDPVALTGSTDDPTTSTPGDGRRHYFVGSEEGDEINELFHRGPSIFSAPDALSDDLLHSTLRPANFDAALTMMFDHPN